jgi:tetratricopeptide (TPR) repeat protein
MVVEQCRFVLLPLSLSVVHVVRESLWIRFPWNILAGLIVLALVAGLPFAWKKDRTMFFGLAWFAVGLLPSLDLIPVAVPLLEHRLYVPLAGAAIAGARLIQILAASPARAGLVRWACLCVIAGAGAVSFTRLPVWANSETLWTDAIEKEPTAGRSYLNLAGYYFEREAYDKTIGLMKQYLTLEPDDLLAYARLRQTYVLDRQYGEAASVCRAMIARNPGNPHRYIELAKFFEQLNQPDSARSVYREAIAADPTSDEAAVDLGILSERLGDRRSAEESYLLATRLAPRHAYPYFALGRLLALDGRDEDALRAIESGAALGEPPKDIVKLALGLYEKHGRRSDAERLKQRYGVTE